MPISTGEEYYAEVWIRESRDYGKKNKLEVRKYHDECPEDPDREGWEHEFDEEYERHMTELDNHSEAEADEPMIA